MISIFLFAAAVTPAWVLKEEVDPLTDKTYASATLTGPNGSIVLKCGPQSAGSLYVGVTSPNKYLGGLEEPAVVGFRFDDNPAVVSYSWIMNDRYAYSFKPSDVYAFLEDLPRSKTVVVQMYNYNKEQVNVTVQVPEDNTALYAVRSKCALPQRPRKK